jgi:hypothetical protein
MAEITHLVIANRACAMFGNSPLQSLDEETLGGQRVQAIFESLLGFCLDLHPFTFTRQSMQLAMTAEDLNFSGYANGFQHEFTVPHGFTINPSRLLRSRDNDDVLLRFEREGDKIYCDEKTCFAQLIIEDHPEKWSGSFTHAFTKALAGELALAMADDKNVSASLKEEAFGPPSMNFRAGLMGAAIQADARNSPVRSLPQSNPLLDAWMS